MERQVIADFLFFDTFLLCILNVFFLTDNQLFLVFILCVAAWGVKLTGFELSLSIHFILNDLFAKK